MSTAPDPAPPVEAGPDAARTDRLLRRANYAVGGAFLLAAGAVLAMSLGRASQAKCGFDWLLAACGSDATFESLLQGAIKRSQDDFEAEYGDRFQPADPDLDKPLEFDTEAFTGFDPSGLTRSR